MFGKSEICLEAQSVWFQNQDEGLGSTLFFIYTGFLPSGDLLNS